MTTEYRRKGNGEKKCDNICGVQGLGKLVKEVYRGKLTKVNSELFLSNLHSAFEPIRSTFNFKFLRNALRIEYFNPKTS